ncbi:MAG: hypothetical protein EON58_15650, partial [Alphaproteobacteria bacterium]
MESLLQGYYPEGLPLVSNPPVIQIIAEDAESITHPATLHVSFLKPDGERIEQSFAPDDLDISLHCAATVINFVMEVNHPTGGCSIGDDHPGVRLAGGGGIPKLWMQKQLVNGMRAGKKFGRTNIPEGLLDSFYEAIKKTERTGRFAGDEAEAGVKVLNPAYTRGVYRYE